MEKEEKKTYVQLADEIMNKANILQETRDIASAIFASEDIRDLNDRFTVINALAHRLSKISSEATSIWVRAHDIWSMAKEAEEAAKTPEQELTELEKEVEDDLPFC